MSYRSVLENYCQKLYSDPFWPIKYFSWVYYHWTFSSVVYGTMFSSLVIVMHLASWIFVYNKALLEVEKKAQTNVVATFHYGSMVTHTLTIPFILTIWMLRGRERVSRILSSIGTIDETLSKFGQCPSKISSLWKLLLLISFPMILIGGLTLGDMSARRLRDTLKARSAWIFHSHYHELIELYVQCFFSCLALFLGDRYSAVNSLLKKMSLEYDNELRNIRLSNFDWIIAVRELRAVHRKLFFIAEEISEAFGLQMLIISIVALFSIIADLHGFFSANFLSCGSVLTIYETAYLVWCLIHLCPLCITAFCCSHTSAQEKYTAVLLQEMSVSDENLRMEISTFSIQLIHHDLRFSVCGFYDVGLSFIQIIIGTVATYLVILIQIENLQDFCKKSSIPTSENISISSMN